MTSLSVVIPTHNRADMIVEAIASCQLQAARARLEVVVVDDASTDDTTSRLQRVRGVKVVRLAEQQGHCAARNVGLEHARGEYLKFLDSDDLLAPGSLDQELCIAEAQMADMVVSGWANARIDCGRPVERLDVQMPRERWADPADAVLAGSAAPVAAVLYRREYVASLRWDLSIPKLADWDWFCQAALLGGRIVARHEIAFLVRQHAGPRVSTGSSMLQNALCSHAILAKIERTLRDRGELSAPRRMRLAQYYYKELRVLSLHDMAAFDRAVDHIHDLDPSFVPVDEERQVWMRWACRWLGLRRALTLHSRLKRALGRAWRPVRSNV